MSKCLILTKTQQFHLRFVTKKNGASLKYASINTLIIQLFLYILINYFLGDYILSDNITTKDQNTIHEISKFLTFALKLKLMFLQQFKLIQMNLCTFLQPAHTCQLFLYPNQTLSLHKSLLSFPNRILTGSFLRFPNPNGQLSSQSNPNQLGYSMVLTSQGQHSVGTSRLGLVSQEQCKVHVGVMKAEERVMQDLC